MAELFSRAGKTLYLVGGTVRDAIAAPEQQGSTGAYSAPLEGGLPEDGAVGDGHTADLDFTTEALPDEIEEIVRGWADAVWLQGKPWGTVGCMHEGRRYEITTHRAEVYRPESRKPQVAFSSAVETDLSRRDFTINAMALRLPELELIDPFDGLGDLARRRLRTPLGPAVSFSDDPLRMLRACRFIARFGLVPQDDLAGAVRDQRARLGIVSAERIRDELDKLVTVSDPSAGLWFAVDTGLAGEFLPELPGLALEQDPVHRHKDVLAHTVAVVARTPADRILRLAALFHDVGKPRTRSIQPGGVSFHHHEVVGERMTRERMKALHYSTEDIEAVSALVGLHLRFHTYRMGWTDRAVRRYVRDAGQLLQRLNDLTRADCTTRNEERARALARRMDELERRIEELRAQEELDAMRPDLDGRQVMEHLGIPPGPDVGRALRFLMDMRLDEGPLGEDEARERLSRWWEEQQREQG